MDLINSAFVLVAVAMAALDLKQVRKDRQVKGLHFATAILFTVWPFWDLFYYASLGQTFSLFACTVLATLRGFWFVDVWRFRK